MQKNVSSFQSSPNGFSLDAPYFTSQIITYIGNKRSLLPFLNEAIQDIKHSLGKEKLITLDGFSGSGVVARLLKYYSSELWVNDLEDYSQVINKCYLANRSEIDLNYISDRIDWLNKNKLRAKKKIGFIRRYYSPRDDRAIKFGERVFYTNENAQIIDNIKRLIFTKIPEEMRHFFLAPLIVEASIHTNTSGVFKGFHKKDGIGHFGGRNENALSRIKQTISLKIPIFSEVECKVHVKKMDTNELVKSVELPKFDLVYYDPPYNQHPYGSNYFMLNLIANNKHMEIQDGVSGIVKDWNRSAYNKKSEAVKAVDDLIAHTKAKYILLSYNNEGIIPVEILARVLRKYGQLQVRAKDYPTYRGSRNLRKRSIRVKELLWILKKNDS